MPVPAPRLSKPLAHPIIKQHRSGDADLTNPFQNLTRTLPVSPTGPPPSFGTREQWINSLPTWRRTKPRRTWGDDSRFAEGRYGQGFQQGLIVAANASVIKGARAQACIPPLFTLLQDTRRLPVVSPPSRQGCDGDVDDEMNSDCSVMDQGQYDNESQWSASSPVGREVDMSMDEHTEFVWEQADHAVVYDEQLYDRGAFTPVFEDEAPGVHDVASSPIEPEPVTPFGEFVDRAVAANPYAGHDNRYSVVAPALPDTHYGYHDKFCGPQCYLAQPYVPLEPMKEAPPPAPAPEPVITPSATAAYKRLAEPLADWVANYVWKVCITGTILTTRSMGISATQYSSSPPDYLAASVHSLLLSTLLQPSAVFLAIWYIVRLPVFFGASLAADHIKELRFRVELLGNARDTDREVMEAGAPFRLVLLGCMLANKWLDDHTFSNKTWHSISNVPIHSLNKLESLTLEIFSYDLSIPAPAWSQWLSDVLQYHLSLSSPSYPQPISRPSTNPHSIVRLAIQELIQAQAACDHSPSRPEPAFLGLEERRKEKSEREQTLAETYVDVLEIDLDEDGPLREEYLPKRRVTGAGSLRSCNSADNFAPRIVINKVQEWERRAFEKVLPPPAKWSPSGDEPILRERNRVSGHYVAVQPPRLSSAVAFPVSPPYHHQMHDIGYRNWPSADGYVAVKQPSAMGHVYESGPHHTAQPNYNPFGLPIASHSRSHSSYDPDNSQSHNHTRSYSQSRVEYRCSDIRMTANELGPAHRADGRPVTQYGYTPYSHAYAPHPSVNYQSTWLRT